MSFSKHQRKDDVTQQYLQQFDVRSGRNTAVICHNRGREERNQPLARAPA